MRSKNASPNRMAQQQQQQLHHQQIIAASSNGRGSIAAGQAHSPAGDRDSKKSNSPTSASGGVVIGGVRRGTQCSITLMDDFDPRQQQNRAGSLPFENLIRPQTLAIPNDGGEQAAAAAAAPTEVYRVRQFVTNKGAVINRGDSFKRSFKRSNQSLSSMNKRDTPNSTNAPVSGAANPNQLNLPDQTFGGGGGVGGTASKTSTSSINETTTTASFNNNNNNLDCMSGSFAMRQMTNANGMLASGGGDNASAMGLSTPASEQPRVETPLVKTYVVYMLGVATVGKNALIKQFKTSEYRGTYDICPHQSTGKYPKLSYYLFYIF